MPLDEEEGKRTGGIFHTTLKGPCSEMVEEIMGSGNFHLDLKMPSSYDGERATGAHRKIYLDRMIQCDMGQYAVVQYGYKLSVKRYVRCPYINADHITIFNGIVAPRRYGKVFNAGNNERLVTELFSI
jgi:hypothetical protein